MLDNPEKFAKAFKSLVARVDDQAKDLAAHKNKVVQLEARVKLLEKAPEEKK